jgi:hypothetical protein
MKVLYNIILEFGIHRKLLLLLLALQPFVGYGFLRKVIPKPRKLVALITMCLNGTCIKVRVGENLTSVLFRMA